MSRENEKSRPGQGGSSSCGDDTIISRRTVDPAPELPELTKEEASDLTSRILANFEHSYTLVAEAFRRDAWKALGYPTWHQYVEGELGGLALRAPAEVTQAVLQSLRAMGLSTRSIAAVTGMSKSAVHRSGAPVPSGTADGDSAAIVPYASTAPPATDPGVCQQVIGRDGKRYPKSATQSREAKTLPQMAANFAKQLRAALDRAAGVMTNERYADCEHEVARELRACLTYVAAEAAAALANLPPEPADGAPQIAAAPLSSTVLGVRPDEGVGDPQAGGPQVSQVAPMPSGGDLR